MLKRRAPAALGGLVLGGAGGYWLARIAGPPGNAAAPAAGAAGDAAGAAPSLTLAPRDPAASDRRRRRAKALDVHGTWVLGGAPPTSAYRRVSERFVAEFDPATRNPRWVVERLSAGQRGRPLPSAPLPVAPATASPSAGAVASISNGSSGPLRPNFREDPLVPQHLRNTLAHFKGSGLDRGHMAAAADMITAAHNQRSKSDEGKQESAAAGVAGGPPSGPAFIEGKSYRELQAAAKAHGLRAVGTRAEISARLAEAAEAAIAAEAGTVKKTVHVATATNASAVPVLSPTTSPSPGCGEDYDEDNDEEDEGDTGALAVARLDGFGDSFYLT